MNEKNKKINKKYIKHINKQNKRATKDVALRELIILH